MKPLSKEVTLTLILKFALLYLLWWMCFSHPVSKQLARPQYAQRLLGDASVSSKTTADTSIGGYHDSRS